MIKNVKIKRLKIFTNKNDIRIEFMVDDDYYIMRLTDTPGFVVERIFNDREEYLTSSFDEYSSYIDVLLKNPTNDILECIFNKKHEKVNHEEE